jgi:hypothetical protein
MTQLRRPVTDKNGSPPARPGSSTTICLLARIRRQAVIRSTLLARHSALTIRGCGQPGVGDRPLRRRARVVRLCRPTRDRAGAARARDSGPTWIVGLPNPLLWGVLAAVLN